MKYFFLKTRLALFVLIATGFTLKGQTYAYFEVSQLYSNLSFTNSAGVKDNNYAYLPGNAYEFGAQHILKTGLIIGGGIFQHSGGAMLNLDNLSSAWNFQYLGLRGSVGYTYNKWRVRPLVLISPYLSNLVSATLNLDGSLLNAKSPNHILAADYGMIFSGGGTMILSDFISIYATDNYQAGLANISGDAGQKAFNQNFYFSLGITATITKNAAQWIQGK